MRREPGRLSAARVQKLSKIEGRHSDGGNLWLQVTRNRVHGNLRASWVFDYQRHGVAHALGLGPYHTVPLALARQKAAEFRRLLLDGIDPLAHRDAQRRAAAVASVKPSTFDEVADRYLREHAKKWRGAGAGKEWLSVMRRFASPVIGAMPAKDVQLADVIRVLEPIWDRIPQTAGRVRGHIENVLDYATVSGLRTGDNPARWKGLLDKKFASKSQLQPVVHAPAMPFAEVADFLRRLRQEDSTLARAIEFIILTASRRREVLEAEWPEVDFENRVWTVPAERMKLRKEHRVPLSDAALRVLEQQRAVQRTEYIFPGTAADRVAPTAVRQLLVRLDFQYTLKGFRSSFRDWGAELTSFAPDVLEAALAHKVPGAVRAAYERGDKFQKRTVAMESWGAYCDGKVTEPAKLRAVS